MSRKDNNFDYEDGVSLKEYFEKVFAVEKEATAKALKLQSSENNRRLDLLNGEATRLVAMQATYLPRETHDLQYKVLADKVNSLELSRAEIKGKADQTTVNITLTIAVIGLILSAIGIIIALLK